MPNSAKVNISPVRGSTDTNINKGRAEFEIPLRPPRNGIITFA